MNDCMVSKKTLRKLDKYVSLNGKVILLEIWANELKHIGVSYEEFVENMDL
jgi:hypothetical protein